jgi:Na+/H+-dicarboxylate symporter
MSLKNNTVLKAYRFPLILLASVILGSIVGLIWKDDAVVLKPLGDIFLNLMFTIVVPLVFISVASSVANVINMKRLGKIFIYMIIIFLATSIISSVVMLIATKIIDPVGGTNIIFETGQKMADINVADQIVKALTVSDFSLIISKTNMLPLVVFAILFGICVKTLGKEVEGIARALNCLSKIMMKFIKYIMYYAPIGIFAYFAALIGEFGPQLLGSYARSMGLYYFMCVFYFFIAFAIYAYFAGGKLGVKVFFRNIFSPSVTALATQSSLASLPTNLEASEKIGIPKDINEMVLPIGASVQKTGSCMAAILKIVFLFGIFGKSFTGLDTHLIAIFIAILSGFVMAGIPSGGLIGEMLIVSVYGFPLEAFPIIATIAFLVDPPATWINVADDSIAAMMVTRLVEGKNWLKAKLKMS